jgi:hypothetical protein
VLVLLSIPLSAFDNVGKFREYRLRGYDTVTKGQIRDAAVAQEAFYAKARTYTDNPTNLYGQYLTPNLDVRLAILPGKGGLEKTYVIVGRHLASEKVFYFDSVSGQLNETTLEDARQAGVRGIDP